MAKAVEDIYSLILESINEGVLTVDETFHITTFNAAAEKITGFSRTQAIGRKCYEVFRGSHCQHDCALRKTMETGTPRRDIQATLLTADMNERPISISTALLRDAEGRMVGGLEIFRDVSEIEVLRRALEGKQRFGDIIGNSPPMQQIFRVLPDVAASDVSVLIEGPSGTGKEVLAHAIHEMSPRRDKPFIRVNCAALPDTLLESELFGYRKGAFTDAKRDKPGHFMQADGGTILLDEIGDVSAAFQVKLLRVLQNGEVHPLGDTAAREINVRVIAATNRDLATMVDEGRFREDLYYRLRVFPLRLPPLKERRTDIPLLVEFFVRQLAAKTGKRIQGVTRRAMEALMAYDYPGNIRELQNILERTFIVCHSDQIDLSLLPSEVRTPPSATIVVERGTMAPGEKARPLAETPDVQRIVKALEANRWNRARAAAELGIARNTLWRRMRRHGLA